MAFLADLVSRVRLELGDQPKEFIFEATADGITKDYYLNAKPVDQYSLYVKVTEQAIPAPYGYKLEQDRGILHFKDPLHEGDKLFVHGIAFRYFTDVDIERFVNTAITQHCHERTDAMGRTMTLGRIPAVEEYPVAILATIEALWALATDASFDIDISAPDGVTIPRHQRYQQLMNTIQQRWDQYHQLCTALNIGLWRIQMGTLRRISRHTNKLVPVYMAQEIDDSRRPERVYVQNDLMGFTPTPSTAGVYDLVIYQGDKFSQVIDFPFDISNVIFKAQIRTYPNSPSLYGTLDVTILDAANGKIKVSLNKDKTAYLPVRAFWDLQATSTIDDTWEKTYLRGQVFVTQQVSLD